MFEKVVQYLFEKSKETIKVGKNCLLVGQYVSFQKSKAAKQMLKITKKEMRMEQMVPTTLQVNLPQGAQSRKRTKPTRRTMAPEGARRKRARAKREQPKRQRRALMAGMLGSRRYRLKFKEKVKREAVVLPEKVAKRGVRMARMAWTGRQRKRRP